jgi:hypothetical protein
MHKSHSHWLFIIALVPNTERRTPVAAQWRRILLPTRRGHTCCAHSGECLPLVQNDMHISFKVPVIPWCPPLHGSSPHASICSDYIDDQRQTRDRTLTPLTYYCTCKHSNKCISWRLLHRQLLFGCTIMLYTEYICIPHRSSLKWAGSLLICSISSQTK